MLPCPDCGAHVRPATACPACGASSPSPDRSRVAALLGLGLGLGVGTVGCTEEMYGVTITDKPSFPELQADPDFADFAGAGAATMTVQNVGPRTAEDLQVAVAPADLGVAAELERPGDHLEPGAAMGLTVSFDPVGFADVDVAVTVTAVDADVVVAVGGAAARLEDLVTAGLAGLDASVPCDATGALTLTNPGEVDRAVVVSVPDPVPRFTLALPPGDAIRVPAGGEVVVDVAVDAATPGEEVLSVEIAPDGWVAHPFGASASASVTYADTGTASVTGAASVALPADADPASVTADVNGRPAVVSVADGVATVTSPAVGPGDVVTVAFGRLAACGR